MYIVNEVSVNKKVFRHFLKLGKSGSKRKLIGIEFHAFGAHTENALVPCNSHLKKKLSFNLLKYTFTIILSGRSPKLDSTFEYI